MPAALLLSLLSAPALAQDSASPPTQEVEAAPSRPIYVLSRGSLAVPMFEHGDVRVAGLGMGLDFENGNLLGMRAIWVPDPPASPLSDNNADVPNAWGPVLDWQYHIREKENFNFYTQASLGFIYGVPQDGESQNVVLPILEGGMGMRFSRRTSGGSRLFIAPEIGLVPAAAAPYAALSVGLITAGGGA